jgi:hypothetical protein
VVDRVDRCPFDREIFNGVADEDGCPDDGAPLVELEADRLALLGTVQFDGARVDERSLRLLHVAARVLALHPELVHITVMVHAEGGDLVLAGQRAEAVRRSLIDAGVDERRLTAEGAPAGRHRVEIRVRERSP